ncbi:MAG: hypothetical protein DRJ29_11400 [Bacteroidetes bacterium]|nr:MAG: hypothetical protein DRI98_06075 [Bacteroidota bacterium]RLD92567.1 MAG: hypothetical protein DRJ29_11400 [Bacteroidota bacterium]
MSYVDLIIKYLSGDLSQEEATSFEKELESNDALKEAFEEQSAAYELIRDQLQKRDQNAFKAKLKEAMGHVVPIKTYRKEGFRTWWYIPPAVACSLAILLIILLRPPGNERVLARYYHPTKDPVVLAYYQPTRGESEPGIIQYRQGNYLESKKLLSERLAQDKDNKLILLFYLLSAMELDRQQLVMELINTEEPAPTDMLDQSISWYSTLALIKSDSREAALEKLHPLTEQEGPYQNDAIKLEKVLLK